MDILVGYGYSPTTTARYFEDCLSVSHRVVYVGTPGQGRPGYLPNVDIVALVNDLGIRPDLFLYVDSGPISYLPRRIEQLACPTAAYLIDVHLGPKLRRPLAALFDYVFVAQRDYVDAYRTSPRQHVEWLPLACDPQIHRASERPRIYDVGFVGHIGSTYDRRTEMLAALDARFKLNDYRRPYSREEMATIYGQSRIVFNSAIRGDLNMRVFEAMASGAMLVTDRIENGLLDLFRDGVDLVTFCNQDELVNRVAYYLEHDEERQAIARAGRNQVLAQHTYSQRAERILDVVFRQAAGACAPMRNASAGDRLDHYARLYSMFRLLDASFDLLATAWSKRQSRGTAALQLFLTLMRRARYG